MKIGYARVSTEEQNLALQIDALKRAGCTYIFTDHGVSGIKHRREGLDSALSKLSKGDSLVVWRLDRLGRSLRFLVDFVSDLGKGDIEFSSLTENIDTSTAGGILIFHVMAALAEFERSLISERTRAGMAAAKERGVRVGRKPALSESQRQEATRLLTEKSINEVAKHFNVHPRTLKRIWENENISKT